MTNQPAEQRRLAAIMFTDMVGYSVLSQRDDKLALDLLEEHRQLLRHIFPRFHGTEIKTIGDAFLVEFNSALDAARCAIEIQRALIKHNTDVPHDRRIEVKIGIHLGDVVHRGGDIYGDGVNIASRIEPLAGAGGICVSTDVERQIRNAIGTPLEKFPPTKLKNIGVPMDLFRIVLPWEPQLAPTGSAPSISHRRSGSLIALSIALTVLSLGVGWWWWANRKTQPTPNNQFAREPSIPEKSIAVLPFANLSGDEDNVYFADGIQDEILTRLAKIADLKVISRTSTQRYKSSGENLSEVGKQLHVAHVVEGSVQKSGDSVRVIVQLLRAADDTHLWAETFDRKLTDIFSVESEIAKAISDQLGARLNGREAQAITAKPTRNTEAYNAYLHGLVYNGKAFTADNITAAQRYFREAVKFDPRFTAAWALLSQVDSFGYLTSNLPVTDATRNEARDAADVALKLDRDSAEALLAKGIYYYACLKDYEVAIRYFEQAEKLLPNGGQVFEMLAYVSRRRGEWETSDHYFKKAELLNPRDVGLLTQHAVLVSFMRRFNDAIRLLDQVLEIVPGDPDTIRQKATVVLSLGDLERSAGLLASIADSNDAFVLRTKTYEAILERKPGSVIPRLQQVLAAPESSAARVAGVLPFLLGWSMDLAGDHAAALESWQRTRRELENSIKEQPSSIAVMASLANTYAALGENALAAQVADRAVATIPIEKDALLGCFMLEIRARVAAQVGDRDKAIPLLQQLLTKPYEGFCNAILTPAILRLDPMFDSLRSDPRFQKLCAEPAK